MKRHSAFTLLELLIVLAILGGVLGLVAPSIRFNSNDDQLKQEAESLRNALQTQIDQSWLKGASTFVRQEDRSLYWFRLENDVWVKTGHQHTIPSSFNLTLVLRESQLNTAIQVLNGPDNADLVFLSSGEYIPFRLIVANDQSDELSILGDGFNALTLE